MALRELDIAMIMVLGACLWAGVTAQSNCMGAIVSLSPCLSYITGNTSTPSSSCCTQFASVVSNQAQCLCAFLNGGASNFGLNINQTQALALPTACNVQTSPVSQCNAVSPAASPTGTPVFPTTPSMPAGSPAAPPTGTPVYPTTPSTPAGPSETTPTAPSTPSETTTPSTTKPSSTPTVPSGSGSRTVPAANGVPSTVIMPLPLLLSLFFIATYASSLTVF